MRLPLEPGDGPLLRSLLMWHDEEEPSHFEKNRVWYIFLIVFALAVNVALLYCRYCRRRTIFVPYLTLVTPGAPTASPVDAPAPPPPPYCKDDPRKGAGHI